MRKKIYRPNNFYLFFESKIINVAQLLIPIFIIWIYSKMGENTWFSTLMFYISLLSCWYIIKPLLIFYFNKNERYVVEKNELVIFKYRYFKEIKTIYTFEEIHTLIKESRFQCSIKITSENKLHNYQYIFLGNKEKTNKFISILEDKKSETSN